MPDFCYPLLANQLRVALKGATSIIYQLHAQY